MCTVCGCGEGETTIEGHEHQHDDGHSHSHVHDHHEHGDHSHDYGQGAAHAHAPGLSQSRMVQIEQDILSKNNQYADANRRYFSEHGILCLNLVSSPGSGKTTLLSETIKGMSDQHSVAVIEGDQQTALDADRIRKSGARAVQINTGKGCHLDAHMVAHAMADLQLLRGSMLFIENVGNLVCPAAFDLGEVAKVVILSVTEGADKPLKYPDMFHAASLMILNKTDLLPYVDFDVAACCDYARRINPGIKIVQLSATTGEGMQQWYDWINAQCKIAQTGLSEAG